MSSFTILKLEKFLKIKKISWVHFVPPPQENIVKKFLYVFPLGVQIAHWYKGVVVTIVSRWWWWYAYNHGLEHLTTFQINQIKMWFTWFHFIAFNQVYHHGRNVIMMESETEHTFLIRIIILTTTYQQQCIARATMIANVC